MPSILLRDFSGARIIAMHVTCVPIIACRTDVHNRTNAGCAIDYPKNTWSTVCLRSCVIGVHVALTTKGVTPCTWTGYANDGGGVRIATATIRGLELDTSMCVANAIVAFVIDGSNRLINVSFNRNRPVPFSPTHPFDTLTLSRIPIHSIRVYPIMPWCRRMASRSRRIKMPGNRLWISFATASFVRSIAGTRLWPTMPKATMHNSSKRPCPSGGWCSNIRRTGTKSSNRGFPR